MAKITKDMTIAQVLSMNIDSAKVFLRKRDALCWLPGFIRREH